MESRHRSSRGAGNGPRRPPPPLQPPRRLLLPLVSTSPAPAATPASAISRARPPSPTTPTSSLEEPATHPRDCTSPHSLGSPLASAPASFAQQEVHTMQASFDSTGEPGSCTFRPQSWEESSARDEARQRELPVQGSSWGADKLHNVVLRRAQARSGTCG